VGAGAETGAGGRWAAKSRRRCADMAACARRRPPPYAPVVVAS
jgi:hypothetical protein